ncbi:MAG TPA: ABC transporter ATP-binding protein [Candidatus Angelobacter sp.]|nr:ABC transporter ATP-binding protein [Candidatus Angelobacter sp.]
MTNTLLQIDHAGKSYPSFTLKDASLKVESGQIVGLVGRNGAGKSTLIKLILGLAKLESGTISFPRFQGDPRQQIGYIPEELWTYENLKIQALLDFLSRIYARFDGQRASGLLKEFDLDPNDTIRLLSKGMRAKLFLVITLSHSARLLILDEPLSSLDPVTRTQFWSVIRAEVDQGAGVLISSHLLEDLEQQVNDIVMIDQGEIRFDQSARSLLNTWRSVRFEAPAAVEAGTRIRRIGPNRYQMVIQAETEVRPRLEAQGATNISVEPASLNDIFLHLCQR